MNEVIIISKQQTAQRYVLKIRSGRLREAGWKLTLPLAEARRNEEIISLGDNLVMRWIDELNGTKNADLEAKNIRNRIKQIKKEPNSLQNRREIKRLYEELDTVQYKPDYMYLVIDKVSDYRRACKGFTVNGTRYVRLLGTNGGIKHQTIIFVSERLAPVLRERIDNGRNRDVPLVPAKLEAYRALTCSGSVPVSMPHGILVVNDCETEFEEDVISLTDEGVDEPVMTFEKGMKITLNESDGYGLMMPSLAQRWSEELRLGYTACGMNTRFSWEKGMVYCFDFQDFAQRVAHGYIVKDAWGNEQDIRNVELILTTSMLKLWNCYDSIEHFLSCCEQNHYTFGVSKNCPEHLENERDLNYQFIQSYDLTDEQIEELIAPKLNYIRGVLSEDYRKALLFLLGTEFGESDIKRLNNDYVKALMVDERMYDDPFIRHRIHQLIRKRIDDAKIGIISVHGNYSAVCGDPYSLCQSIFGLPVTGLLKKGEIYNQYWADEGADKVVCFRAPMTSHNNIRLMKVSDNEDIRYWYRYMNACTVFNSWDTTVQALNGMDKDGDIVLLTDNKVLIENFRPLPTIMCVQRSADKVVVEEKDLIASNINSFGDDIGATTNRITSMFDVQSGFPPDSKEYKTLEYRIICGQLFQQNSIDRSKGIVAKPMPKWWYNDRSKYYETLDSEEAKFQHSISAGKKPYFMRYIYPDLAYRYNKFIKNTGVKCARQFQCTIDELYAKDESQRTEEERRMLAGYERKLPVSTNDCVLNRICRRFEREFDHYFATHSNPGFDYRIMKSGEEYSLSQYKSISGLSSEYQQRLKCQVGDDIQHRTDSDAIFARRVALKVEFVAKAFNVCSNARQLCDIILDACYCGGNAAKMFCWAMCAEQIISNLLEKNGGKIHYPVKNPQGDIEFCGERFSLETAEVCDE